MNLVSATFRHRPRGRHRRSGSPGLVNGRPYSVEYSSVQRSGWESQPFVEQEFAEVSLTVSTVDYERVRVGTVIKITYDCPFISACSAQSHFATRAT